MQNDAEELKKRYANFAKSLDYRTTARDFQLRELEIDTADAQMRDGMSVLDVGCGLGYAACQYATRRNVSVHGIDYSENMIDGARKLLQVNFPKLVSRVQFATASVTELPYEGDLFDVVTSHRCLMALLDWELQKKALLEICRVLKPNGTLVLMEGTFEGLEKLNDARRKFGLAPIAPDGRDRLITLKFHESELLNFCETYYQLERTQRFGMYYFLTRIVQPLLVAPEQPSYDHKINDVAMEIAKVIPEFEGIGHLVAFIFSKRAKGRT